MCSRRGVGGGVVVGGTEPEITWQSWVALSRMDYPKKEGQVLSGGPAEPKIQESLRPHRS